MVSQIPCDTTEYKLAPTAETGIINWYQCNGKWRLQWLMEDIQDLLQIETKSNYECEQIKLMTEELKRRIMNERIIPEKQEEAGIQFFVP